MATRRTNIVPDPTPIYRIVHVDNLATLVARKHIHAPNHVPADGCSWTGVHAVQTQIARGQRPVPCGPRGVILDYVGFYLGPRSPMLYRIHTGWNVAKVDQSNIVYLVSTAQAVRDAGLGFVFTDRHSLARVAAFYDDLTHLGKVDFQTCHATQWTSTPDSPDRQERKQAEFLVHRGLDWSLIHRVGVANPGVAARVRGCLGTGGRSSQSPQVTVERDWYYW